MTEITITKPSQVATALDSEKIKAQVAEIVTQCDEIQIVDESSAAIGTQILSNANKLVTLVEKKRKLLKAPFMDMGKAIDNVAKEISSEIEASVAAGKAKLLAYNKKLQEQKLAEDNRLAEEKRLAEFAAENEVVRIKKITDWLITFETEANRLINNCKTQEQLQNVYAATVKDYPNQSFFEEFTTDAQNVLTRIKAAGSTRKKLIDELDAADIAKKNILLAQEKKRQEIMQRNLDANTNDLTQKQESALEAVELKKDVTVAGIASETIANEQQKVSRITKRWDFEIVDMNLVPRAYLKVDDVAIRAWINQNKQVLNDGEVISGIKYFQKEGVRLS